MNLLNGIILKEDDNIDLLLSMIALDEEKPPKTSHHELDDEMLKVINDNQDEYDHYSSQLYQALVSLFHENCELKKKIDILTACNELLKNHIASITKNSEDSDQSFHK